MLSVVLTLFAASDVYQAESVASSCECDNTAAIIGGVVAVVTAAVTTVVVILRSCRGHYSTPKTRTRYITSVYQTVLIQLSVYRGLADVPAATDQALELSKFSEATYVKVSQTETLCALFLPVTSQYRVPDSFQTTSNEAYNVVKRETGRGGGGGGGEYENPQNLRLPTSSQPTTTAAGEHEPV